MWQVRSAQTPFQTRKRSFDLAWGAWAGILAVMTAVGAAFSGSQILLMYPRAVHMVEVKYPSMPKAGASPAVQFDADTPALFLSKESVFLGFVADLSAPVRPGQILLKPGQFSSVNALVQDIENWCAKNLKKPVRHLALGNSPQMNGLTIAQMAEVLDVFKRVNAKMFQVNGLVPNVVPIDLANPI